MDAQEVAMQYLAEQMKGKLVLTVVYRQNGRIAIQPSVCRDFCRNDAEALALQEVGYQLQAMLAELMTGAVPERGRQPSAGFDNALVWTKAKIEQTLNTLNGYIADLSTKTDAASIKKLRAYRESRTNHEQRLAAIKTLLGDE